MKMTTCSMSFRDSPETRLDPRDTARAAYKKSLKAMVETGKSVEGED